MSFLSEVPAAVEATVVSGYYDTGGRPRRAPSFAEAIRRDRERYDLALVAEVKPAAPSVGRLIDGNVESIMRRYLNGGACALSVLTEPKFFQGRLENLEAAVALGAPTLMKDFILSDRQVDCAAALGASAVLLVERLLKPKERDALIKHAHDAGREILLECADRKELEAAVASDADVLGINNRDLETLEVDLGRTLRVTEGLDRDPEVPLLSLSGFSKRKDVEAVVGRVDGILVGTSLLQGRITIRELMAR